VGGREISAVPTGGVAHSGTPCAESERKRNLLVSRAKRLRPGLSYPRHTHETDDLRASLTGKDDPSQKTILAIARRFG
jgi:hypothetical protein